MHAAYSKVSPYGENEEIELTEIPGGFHDEGENENDHFHPLSHRRTLI